MSFIGGDPSQQVFETVCRFARPFVAWRITSLMEVLRSLRTNDHPGRRALWDSSSVTQGVHQSTRRQFQLGAENTSKRREMK
jgi:hypothetical protein